MLIANDERLSILKEYARKHFRLTKNVRILVLLISEKENDEYRRLEKREIENNIELQEFIKKHSVNKAHHETLEIFSAEACLIDLKNKLRIKLLRELIIKSKTKVHHIEKYEFLILIKGEMLDSLGRRKFPSSEGYKANFAEEIMVFHPLSLSTQNSKFERSKEQQQLKMVCCCSSNIEINFS